MTKGKPWSHELEKELIELVGTKTSLAVIAKKLGVDDPLAEASNFAIDINNKINENK